MKQSHLQWEVFIGYTAHNNIGIGVKEKSFSQL